MSPAAAMVTSRREVPGQGASGLLLVVPASGAADELLPLGAAEECPAPAAGTLAAGAAVVGADPVALALHPALSASTAPSPAARRTARVRRRRVTASA